MSSAVAASPVGLQVPLASIDVGENIRDLDAEHVATLASSIAMRGLISPLTVRPHGDRWILVAGYHRHAACVSLGLEQVPITPREREKSSADSAAENVVRKQLNPLEEALAIKAMLDEGYTTAGAASILGWSQRLVTERSKILELSEDAQDAIGAGAIQARAVDVLLQIQKVSAAVCEATVAVIASGEVRGESLLREPIRAIASAVKHSEGKVFGEYLTYVSHHQVAALRLGKKIEALLTEAETLHKQIDRYSYGPPRIEFAEQDIDQARAAGVLIEFEGHGWPVIVDRGLYRELVKQAITRTLEQLRTTAKDRASSRGVKRTRSKHEQLDRDHRASLRNLTARAHNTNLDLGAALIDKLSSVDPADMDVARFYAYGLLGSDQLDFRGAGPHTVAAIAANGIRLVIGDHRSTTTPKLKNGGWGKTKVSYGEIQGAAGWLWKYVEGAQTAGELYGRVLVVFASQHYANQLVLAQSKRHQSILPHSHKDTARKAFTRVTKKLLPGTHLELLRAIEREARDYNKRVAELTTSQATAEPADSEDSAAERQAGTQDAEL